MEIWKKVEGYEGLYEVSNLGRVKALPRNRVTPTGGRCVIPAKILKQTENKGYNYVSLFKDGKNRMKKVHRLVAIAFIPNPYNRPVVNHKDYDTQNNKADNLEWTTQKENVRHSIKNMKRQHNCKTKTGERYITIYRKKYLVCITKFRIHKLFNQLDEAIAYRNERLEEYDYHV